MAQIGVHTQAGISDRWLAFAKQSAIVIGASAVIAVCARLVLPLPFTPVPLTLANFGVLLGWLVSRKQARIRLRSPVSCLGRDGPASLQPRRSRRTRPAFWPHRRISAGVPGRCLPRRTAIRARHAFLPAQYLCRDSCGSCTLRFWNRLAASRHGKLAEGLRFRPCAIFVCRSHQSHACGCRGPQTPAFDLARTASQPADEVHARYSGVTARPI